MKVKLLVAVGALAASSVACSPGNNFRDLEGIKSQEPDLVEVYSNVDRHPNIAKVCIDGVAFATTTREGNSAITRVEAWDRTCPGGSQG